MARRKRRRPERPRTTAEQTDPIRAELRNDFGLVVEKDEGYDAAPAEQLLRDLLDALRAGQMNPETRDAFNARLIEAGLTVRELTEAEEDGETAADVIARETEAADRDSRAAAERPDIFDGVSSEEGNLAEAEDDFDGSNEVNSLSPLAPEVELPPFQWGPLAAGIQMLEAMLTEAKAGYITAQIGALEQAIHESFTPDEHVLMAEAASNWRDANGLPDVPAAYQALVVHRATGEAVI